MGVTARRRRAAASRQAGAAPAADTVDPTRRIADLLHARQVLGRLPHPGEEGRAAELLDRLHEALASWYWRIFASSR